MKKLGQRTTGNTLAELVNMTDRQAMKLLEPLTLGEMADEVRKVKRQVERFWRDVGLRLRELEKYKLERGICIGGVSCMKFATHGRNCSEHSRPSKRARPLSQYGLMKAAERVLARKERKKTGLARATARWCERKERRAA